jgi:hypothetical protein
MFKKVFLGIFILLLAIAGYFGYQWYFTNDNFMRQIYLVPGNAVYVIQTSDPIKNWKKFSSSKMWLHLKQHQKFEGISKSADAIDKFFNDNEKLLGSLGSREFTMSAHVTKLNDYDFLFIIDLSKASKISILKSSVENVFSNLGYKVTVHKYKDETIYEMFDATYHQTLYLSIIANQAVCSYYGVLVENAIDEQTNPTIAKENKFIEVEQKTKESGLARLFINYKHSDEFLRCYMNNLNGVAADLSAVLEFSGLSLGFDNDDIDINGYTNLKDSTDSYLLALLQSGKGNIGAYKILPARTAAYTSVGCDNFLDFYDNLTRVFKNDKKAYNDFENNVNKIEKYLKINLKTNFYSWMGGEVVLSQNASVIRSAPEYIITIHANNIDKAKENLNFIEEQIKKRTPAKFEKTSYRDHEIHYLEVKGLFNVLLGKFFSKIEKPYYTVIDDYVCFSNKPETIIALIEDYENKNTLGNDEEFKTFIKRCNDKASVFCYVNGPRYFNSMLSDLKGESRNSAQENKKYIICFRNTAFQLIANDKNFETRLLSNFVIPADSELNAVNYGPISMNEQDTLTLLERFYVEQFSKGSIMEDYDNGKARLRAETKDGLKDGKYREYYDDGGIKVKGSYSKGKKDGRWKYYDQNGKVVRRERYDDGVLK